MVFREAAAVQSRWLSNAKLPSPGTRERRALHRAAVQVARHLSGCGHFLSDCTTKHRFPRTVCRHRRTVYDKRCAVHGGWCAVGGGRCAVGGFACAVGRERCAEKRAWCAKHLSWCAVWRNARVSRHRGAVQACEEWSSGGFAALNAPAMHRCRFAAQRHARCAIRRAALTGRRRTCAAIAAARMPNHACQMP